MSYSFEIKNSKDLFLEFLRLHDEYRKDIMSSGKAVSCSIFAWHVVEWIKNELLIVGSNKNDYYDLLKLNCPSLQYIQDIANGTKHRSITLYTPAVKSTDLHSGAFSQAFSPEAFSRQAFDISGLKMTLGDGSEVFFDEEILKVRNFLCDYFFIALGVNLC